MYQSFQERDKNKRAAAYEDDDINDWAHLLHDEGESSRHEDVMTQEAIDEALARSLQELGEGFEDLLISEHSGSGSASGSSKLTYFSLTLKRDMSVKHTMNKVFSNVKTKNSLLF